MPIALIIAGPNGAGKTTFANALFAAETRGWPYLNADDIGREPSLAGLPPAVRELRAGRVLLARLDHLVASGADFGVETTLSSGLYARRIPSWRVRGYRVHLIYVRLPNVEASIARVARRVALGGHGVPEADLRRRFGRSVQNLETLYKPLVDTWRVWDAGDAGAILAGRSPS